MGTLHLIQRVSGYAKALSEEIRVRILICLKGGPLSLQHFIDIFELAPSTLSKHLHILESAGLVVSIRQGRWRLYQWPAQGSSETALELLNWLKSAVLDDPMLQTDAARRAVAIQNSAMPLPKNELTRVLFLCTGNSCRSQMAEALLRTRGGPLFEVASAGVVPRPIPGLTVEVMREIGIDMRDHKPKSVMEFIGKTYFDYLITVCSMAEAHTPVFPGVSHRLIWPMEDPAAAEGNKSQKKKIFRQVRDCLDAQIGDWLKSLAQTR
ncbi:MAG: metalloregulator ArsR/SmtB family transcription factor [Deltaproteobacteria bacterium]|nr:metalloregulator ArsR/SmtB family transcription factor [Deltaproteobacteria bacterium]